MKEGLASAARKQLIRYVRSGVAALFALVLLVGGLRAITAQSQVPTGAAHFFTSLHGIHVVGYQGWFDCPGDGAGLGWVHWFVGNKNPNDPNSIAVDEWPDTSELGPDERCPTAFKLPSGAPAYLFSDQNPKTVARHFLWMKQYGIDGVTLSRFANALTKSVTAHHMDTVLNNARAGAEANGRGLFVIYDVTGMNGAAALQVIERDWPHLTGDLHLTDSAAYIYHRGKPVVGVWGLGFKTRDAAPEQAAAIIHFLKTASVPATVLGGVPTSWRNLGADNIWTDSRTDPKWAAIYRSFDVISPWSVGRYSDDPGADTFMRVRIIPDLAETRRLGIDYMPVVFPGYSFYNTGRLPMNSIPRRCGLFYTHQINNVIQAGASMLLTAMFDEVNEGTAIFKLAVNPSQLPVSTHLIPLDSNGCTKATSDMYLRIAGTATRLLRAQH